MALGLSPLRLALVLLYTLFFNAHAMAQSSAASDRVSPQFIERILPGARLSGSGELRFFGFKIYDARLWVLPRGSSPAWAKDPAKLLEHSFALDLRYVRNLKGEEIAERSLAEIRRLGFGDAAQHERWLADMKKVFPDIVRGDHLTGVFDSSGATKFFLNEKAIGRIEDADFGAAFFNIWFDARTRSPGLRESLTKASN
jgi:hypothetical protein